MIPIENRPYLVSSHLHCDSLRDSGSDQIPDRRAPKIMGNRPRNACSNTRFFPGGLKTPKGLPLVRKNPRADYAGLPHPLVFRSLLLQNFSQLVGHGKDSPFFVLRCSGIQTNLSSMKINLLPLQRENFTSCSPSGYVSESYHRRHMLW